MSASSASYTAAGAPTAAAGDIIDLDRYMRTALRPSRHAPSYTREHLVVDAGGPHRMPLESLSSSISEMHPRTYKKHCKRYSHDSGLSDDSYVKRRHKPHRRISNNKYQSSRTEASDSSLREFRATCEKALREQQEQIARVADICNKLVQPNIAQTATQNLANVGKTQPIPQQIVQNYQNLETQLNHKTYKKEVVGAKQNFGQNVTQKSPRTTSTYSSDMTSSTPSRVGRRKDQHRTDSCKTYKLIIGKLDELSRVFATRRAPPAPAPRRGSSGSVSVCDKMVATTPTVQVLHTSRMSNHKRPDTGRSRARKAEAAAATRYIGEESIVEQWIDSASEVAPDAFDLENPLHLYAQAKRLQALHASTERRTSPSPGPPGAARSSSSLCALCRGYWRTVRRYVKQQLFGTYS